MATQENYIDPRTREGRAQKAARSGFPLIARILASARALDCSEVSFGVPDVAAF